MHGKYLADSLLFGLVVVLSIAVAEGWKDQSVSSGANKAAVKATPKAAAKSSPKANAKIAPKANAGRCDPDKQQSADLSGTYKGIVNYPDGGLSGEATLTITGNQFLLSVGNAAQTGRITAITTCNYTAATMMFGEVKKPEPGQPAPPPLPVISLRAIKKADAVTLTAVPGERRTFSFAPKTGK